MKPGRARSTWLSVRLRLAPHYSQEIFRATGTPQSLLDVGCGSSSPVGMFPRRIPRTIGVEGYEPAFHAAERAAIHDQCRLLDARLLGDAFAPRSFDVVLAVDLLEHLGHDEGRRLLAAMESIARERVVVFTPNGHVPQGTVAGNPLQVHRSGWTVAELRADGYDVTGVHGLRFLRGEEAAIRWRPARLWRLVSDLTQPLVRRLPSLAYHLLAVKETVAP